MKHLFLLLFLSLSCFQANSQNVYFPPINNNSFWDTLSPQSLGWCTNQIDSLYLFLEAEDSKAFIVLKDGRIVLEKYFGSFTQDSIWYWASAGKTLTSFLVGKAQEDGILNLSDSSSRFLSPGWTNESPQKERKITIRNQLTMTSGLDDGVPDNHCTIDTCLNYLADAGNRWAYHNAPFTLLEKVLETASGQSVNLYTQQKLKAQTGITGAWFTSGYDNVFYSKPRSMARFGILIQNQCKWNNTTLLSDTTYIRQMTATSQQLNKSYGYLWWLNGKSSFMVPTSQLVFPGSFAPDAPSDMVAAIGKNGQILSIAPSSGIVYVRMGNATTTGEVPFLFCSEIWEKLNKVICPLNSVSASGSSNNQAVTYPNPFHNQLTLNLPDLNYRTDSDVWIQDLSGKVVIRLNLSEQEHRRIINTQTLRSGLYFLSYRSGDHRVNLKIWKD